LAAVALGQQLHTLLKAVMAGLLFLTPQPLMRLQVVLLLLVAEAVLGEIMLEVTVALVVAATVGTTLVVVLAQQVKDLQERQVFRKVHNMVEAVVAVLVLWDGLAQVNHITFPMVAMGGQV
jgi:chromate transport protein ChrA